MRCEVPNTLQQKTCPKCKETKDLIRDNFHLYKRGWCSYCIICEREIKRAYYNNNTNKEKERQRAKNKQYRTENTRKLFELIQRRGGCQDCGVLGPLAIYDFHHVRGIKRFNVSDRVGNRPWATIKKEIDKCVLICCNCHRVRTAVEKGYYKCLDGYEGI